MKKPLVWMALLFSLGILAANHVKIPLTWQYCSAGSIILALIFLLKRKFPGAVLLALLVLICGMVRLSNYRAISESHIQRFHYQPQKVYQLLGWIISQPRVEDNKTTFLLRVEEIADDKSKQVCAGEILVMARDILRAEYGDELIIEGALHRPFGAYLRGKGIFLVCRVKAPYFIRETGVNKGWPIKRVILKLKSAIETGFEKNLSPICAGIVEAMTLGEEKNVPVKVYKDMVRSGTVHILVVSGSNVGIVGFIVILLLKIFRIPRRIRLILSVPIILAYCLLTGASNPVVRATIMAVVFLFAYFFKRQPDIYNSCSFAVIIILGLNPDQIFDIGFQLSFASVLSIAFFYPRLKDRFRLAQFKCRWLRFLAEGCLVSLSAWLGTAGLIAAYFRMVSPVTVLANLLIVPLASLITLSGFSLLITQSVSAYLALSFASGNEFLVSLLLSLNSQLLRIPHAFFYF